MRTRLIGAALVLAAVVTLGAQTAVVARTGFFMGDFRAFYCAAAVATHGGDPYRTEPLRTCENSIGPKRFFEKNPGVTIPAPLPGYAVAMLEPFAALPFGVAAALWGVVLLVASITAIATLVRFAAVSWHVALAVFALSLCAISLPFGEVVPIAVAFICAAAYFAWQARWVAAALCAALAMLEPHLGLPVCIALAVWAPASRVSLALALSVLGAISVAVLGPATNLEYFTSVLPAHAISEVARDTQYSLTAVLFSAGTPENAAVRSGALWYLVMLALGTLVAGLLAKRTANAAFLASVPPAFAVFGGTFIHVTQIAAALPAAVLLVSYTKAEYRTPVLIALLALAAPWAWAISPALMIAPVFPVGYLASEYWNGSLRATLIATLAAAALWVGLAYLVGIAPHVAPHPAPAIDPRLAEASWSVFTAKSSTNGIAAWMLRIPTWAGLGLLLLLLTRDSGLLKFSRCAIARNGAARMTTCCVIPAYRASKTVCDVVRNALRYVDAVIVVDDGCPEGSGDAVRERFRGHPSVQVMKRSRNGGVGAATKTGIEQALQLSPDVIVKLDADGQMDPSYIPAIAELFAGDPNLAYVKGNRFLDSRVLSKMPAIRLFGNSCLSLCAKFASGYWNILDPTNGYLAFNGRVLPAINWQGLADRYFFEISALCEFGLIRANVAEVDMETTYGDEPSSLSISRTLFSFPPKLARLFLRRLLLQYFLFDVNLGSLYIMLGVALCAFGAGFAAFEWVQSALTGVPRTTGTVMLAVLPFLMGFQLLLNALLYDVQFSAKSMREVLGQKVRREQLRNAALN